MPSTYSDRLRIELIGTGEQSGIWGDTTNTNLGTLIEEAIAGVASITMTDANYTLTTANGATDQARQAVLVMSGTLSAARDVICPNEQKVYVVKNSTTGGHAITIKTAAGTGVSVANGTTVLVYCDATNVYLVADQNVTNNPSFTGNISLDGAVVVNDSGADKDFRVEGDADANLIFADASTDRVGIGTNAPTAKLTVSGTTAITGNTTIVGDSTITGASSFDGIVVVNESGADKDFRVEGDTDTHLLFTDASTDFVGVGTSTPGSKLDVKGTLRLSGSTSGYVGFVPAAAAGSTTYTLPSADGSSGQFLSTNGSGLLAWASALSTSVANTFTAKQTFAGTSSNLALALDNAVELTTISATAATGTINFDVTTQAVLYYTTNASANFTINIRGNSTTTLNSLMATGDAVTVVFLCTNGGTAYYNSAVQIDGSSVTPKWQGGGAPASGNAGSVDAYVYTVEKTANATFTVFASQTQFA